MWDLLDDLRGHDLGDISSHSLDGSDLGACADKLCDEPLGICGDIDHVLEPLV